jgi:DUF1009 family protein
LTDTKVTEANSDNAGALGVICGAGELPVAVAQAAREAGRDVFLVGILGLASEPDLSEFDHGIAGIGEFGKIVRLLKEAKCSDVTFAGKVPRPKFSEVRLDARGALALPGIVSAARHGDDVLMRTILEYFEKDGFRVIGTEDAARQLLAPKGIMGSVSPNEQDLADISKALAVVRAMGAHDIGQAAIVCEGVVLTVEAAEGTDAMIERAALLPEALRGTDKARRGVLLKAPKPSQERRMDLPVIGRKTLKLAKAAGLRGIAVEADGALILHRSALTAEADKSGIFLLGFDPEDYPV